MTERTGFFSFEFGLGLGLGGRIGDFVKCVHGKWTSGLAFGDEGGDD